jgi:hypothetical protein
LVGPWWSSRSCASALLIAAAFLECGISLAACGGSAETPDPPKDAASDAGDAGIDSPSSPEEDAGPSPADGGRDAAREASAGSFCATRTPQPKFCDDFDDGELEGDWDSTTILNGEPALDTSVATSLPASLVVGTLPLVDGESAHAHLRTTATGAPTGHVVLSFELMLATATYTKGVVAIATLDVSSNHFFTLYLRDGDADSPAATLEEIAPASTTRHVLTKLPPANVWTRATIDIDLANAKASVLWGAEKALDQAPIAAGAAEDPTVRIGAVYVYGPADAFEARFDDVTLDF